MTESNKKFLVYLASYLGVAMIGGSIVHIGTLGDHGTRYLILGIVGVILMIVGSIFEARINKEVVGIKYFSIVTALAIATGFLSGGVQHFLDNPVYAGYLLSIGLVVAYLTFARKYNLAISTKGFVAVIIAGLLILLVSNTIPLDSVSPDIGGHHH